MELGQIGEQRNNRRLELFVSMQTRIPFADLGDNGANLRIGVELQALAKDSDDGQEWTARSVGLARGFQPSNRCARRPPRSEEHTSELQSRPHLVCRLLLEK